MPMPRSFGSSQVTFLLLIQICPSVMSSSPAMQFEQRRLAAARRPEQHDELALGHVDVELVEHVDVPVGEGQVLDDDAGHGAYPFTAPAAMPRTKSLPETK